MFLPLNFFSKVDSQNKNIEFKTPESYSTVLSGKNHLYFLDKNELYQFDHKKSFTKANIPLERINFAFCSKTTGDFIAIMANHDFWTGVRYSEENLFNGIGIEKIPFKSGKKKTGMIPTAVASRSLNYIAFSFGNELYISRANFKENSKPITFSEDITNVCIGDNGIAYITTDQKVILLNIESKAQNVIDNAGALPKMAHLLMNETFFVYRDKNIISYNMQGVMNTFKLDNPIINIGTIQNYTYIASDLDTSESFKVIDINLGISALNAAIGKNLKKVEFVWGALILILNDNKVLIYPEISPSEKVRSLSSKLKFEFWKGFGEKITYGICINIRSDFNNKNMEKDRYITFVYDNPT